MILRLHQFNARSTWIWTSANTLRYHSTSVNHLCKQSGDLNVFYQTGMRLVSKNIDGHRPLISTISALDRAGLQLDISSRVTGLDLNLLYRATYMHLPNSNTVHTNQCNWPFSTFRTLDPCFSTIDNGRHQLTLSRSYSSHSPYPSTLFLLTRPVSSCFSLSSVSSKTHRTCLPKNMDDISSCALFFLSTAL